MSAPNKVENVASLSKKVRDLTERIEAIEARYNRPRGASINKVETFNGEEEPQGRPGDGLKQTKADMVVSMQNAMKILNPKLKDKDGRHDIYNVCAVCGYTGMLKSNEAQLYEIFDEATATLK